MKALGRQGFHVIRQAAETAAMGMNSDEPPAPLIPKKARKPRKPRAAASPVPASPVFDRETLRLKLEAASIRPMPGTSELLKRALHTEFAFGYTDGGKLTNGAESHDLTALAPIHLKKREE